MKSAGHYPLFVSAHLLLVAFAGEVDGAASDPLPEASSVLARLEQRSDEVARTGRAAGYVYKKRTQAEELDNSGKAVKATEKIYEVVPIDGVPFSRLVRIQDRDLTEEESKQQARKEAEFRRKLAEKGARARREDELLNVGLIARYDFKMERRDKVENRSVLVLSFRPKPKHAPEETVKDRVLNRLSGTLWVDEEEAEVVRVEVGLTEDLWLGWFGMVGSLKRCDFKIQRQRLPDGVWVNKEQTLELAGRKVFTPLRGRTLEEFYDFRKT
jgi:hypothetical protein